MLKHPQRAQSWLVISFCFVLLFSSPLMPTSLQSIFSISTGSLSCFPFLQLYLGPDGFCSLPFYFVALITSSQTPWMERGVCSGALFSGTAAPYQDRWLSRLFLTVSGEEDSTTYFEICSTD